MSAFVSPAGGMDEGRLIPGGRWTPGSLQDLIIYLFIYLFVYLVFFYCYVCISVASV